LLQRFFQLHAGTKKLQVKLVDKTYKIRNDILAEAMEYTGLIEKGSKTLNDVPAALKSLVTA
jgi:hypothetical protein